MANQWKTVQGLSYTVPPSFEDLFGKPDNYFQAFSPFDLTGAMNAWAKRKNLEKKFGEVESLIRYLDALWDYMSRLQQ